MRQRCLMLFAILPLLLVGRPTLADSAQDAKVIFNTLKYVRGLELKESRNTMGILYSPKGPVDQKEAQVILDIFNKTASVRGDKLQLELIDVDKLKEQKSLAIIYIPAGMEAKCDMVASYSQKNHIFVIGKGMDCVQQKICILGVQTDRGVNIYLSDEALHAAGFEVDAAFRFMVKRL